MRDYKIFELSNGIKVVHQFVKSTEIVHCGIFLDIGSRDETPETQGIAHFWEHMAFKGTKKRKAFHIINSIDSVGGELNAYTEKEKIVLYASVRSNYFERAVDILSDIAFNSAFPEKQIERERGVILEEMSMYFDDPDDSIQDEFEGLVFKGHPLGMNILGRPETIKSFKKKDFVSFFKNHLNPHGIVFSCVGNVTEALVEQMARTYLEPVILKQAKVKRKKFSLYKPGELILRRNVKQARCAIGGKAYGLKDPRRIPFFMLVNILGGPGMNSRLNLALREKYGFVYSVDALYAAYFDTGIFSLFFGTEPKQLSKCINIIKRELEKLASQALGDRQLSSAKEQIKGQLALAEESNLSVMQMMGRSVLDFGRVPSLKEIFDKIDNVDSLSLMNIAQDMFDTRRLSYLTMEPNIQS